VANSPESLAFAPDSEKLAVISTMEIVIVDVSSVQISNIFQNVGGKSLTFSPDGNYIYIHSFLSVNVIDPQTGTVILKFPDPLILVPTLSASEDGSSVVITYESPDTIGGFALSPDGEQIVTYTRDASQGASLFWLAHWEPETGKYLTGTKFTSLITNTIKFSPDGSLLAIGNGSEIWLWDTMNWQVIKKLSGHTNPIVDMAFTPDGKSILSAGLD